MSHSLWSRGQYSPPDSSVHGILQARILEWIAILFSRGSSRPRNQTRVSCIEGRFSTIWVPTLKYEKKDKFFLTGFLNCVCQEKKETKIRNRSFNMKQVKTTSWSLHCVFNLSITIKWMFPHREACSIKRILILRSQNRQFLTGKEARGYWINNILK